MLEECTVLERYTMAMAMVTNTPVVGNTIVQKRLKTQ